ncbi:MAG: hypothetical protein Q9M39_03490 [Sulfurovum sp.]|nr:hypothetical protein [Sulfurovum sp.]
MKTSKKTSKKNHKKVTEDVLLKHIFTEISNENKESNLDNYLLDDISPLPQTKSSKIQETQKKRQWFLIGFLTLSVLYVWFNTDANPKPTPIKVEKKTRDNYIFPKETVLDKPKEFIESPDIKTNPIKDKDIKILTVRKPKIPQTEREKAKASLFKQMQN